MKEFINYRQDTVILSPSSWVHIQEIHAEITLEQISRCLADPDEVRASQRNPASELYYLIKSHKRFICLVVKKCSDGFFIATAMTTAKQKVGDLIYRRG